MTTLLEFYDDLNYFCRIYTIYIEYVIFQHWEKWIFCIFLDPVQWSTDQVLHWVVWVMKEFSMTDIDLNTLSIPGRELCSLSQEDFFQRVPRGEILWSHLELLRKCTCVFLASVFFKKIIKCLTLWMFYSSHSVCMKCEFKCYLVMWNYNPFLSLQFLAGKKKS